MKTVLFRIGNMLYEHCYPLYLPLYACYKILSDRQERVLLRRIVRPGMSVVDVGANIGMYSRFLARLAGSQGRVHAFEPAPENFARLIENTAAFTNVTAIHAAVGNENGMTTLCLSGSMNTDHHTYDCGDARSRLDVRIVRLDDYFRVGEKINLIKIDVQGYEYRVLQGARRIMEENRGELNIVMEFWPHGLIKAGTAPLALLDLIQSLGYSFRLIGGGTGKKLEPRLLDGARKDYYCNLLITGNKTA